MGSEVHLEAPAPLLLGERLERAGRGDAGVEDDSVDPAEAAHGNADEAVDDGSVGQIAGEGHRAIETLGGLGEAVGIDVGEDQVGAAGREVEGDVPADAGRGAGDERDMARRARAAAVRA